MLSSRFPCLLFAFPVGVRRALASSTVLSAVRKRMSRSTASTSCLQTQSRSGSGPTTDSRPSCPPWFKTHHYWTFSKFENPRKSKFGAFCSAINFKVSSKVLKGFKINFEIESVLNKHCSVFKMKNHSLRSQPRLFSNNLLANNLFSLLRLPPAPFPGRLLNVAVAERAIEARNGFEKLRASHDGDDGFRLKRGYLLAVAVLVSAVPARSR